MKKIFLGGFFSVSACLFLLKGETNFAGMGARCSLCRQQAAPEAPAGAEFPVVVVRLNFAKQSSLLFTKFRI